VATTLQLPSGCYGIQMPGGQEINGRPGGRISVPDEYVPAIKASNAGRNGILDTQRGTALGTRRGRRCLDQYEQGCTFLAQAWSTSCPRCGSPTQEE
jgi:hypothetical protein